MHVIYSRDIKGAGLIAGGPYMVAEESDIFTVDPKAAPQTLVDETFRKINNKCKNG